MLSWKGINESSNAREKKFSNNEGQTSAIFYRQVRHEVNVANTYISIPMYECNSLFYYRKPYKLNQFYFFTHHFPSFVVIEKWRERKIIRYTFLWLCRIAKDETQELSRKSFQCKCKGSKMWGYSLHRTLKFSSLFSVTDSKSKVDEIRANFYSTYS